jgi:Leucine-rich repeat (LRR) protein
VFLIVAQELVLCHNSLSSLPMSVSQLSRLSRLDVSLNTELRELPLGLSELTQLNSLVACHMRVKTLHE